MWSPSRHVKSLRGPIAQIATRIRNPTCAGAKGNAPIPSAVEPRDRATTKSASNFEELCHEGLKNQKKWAIEYLCHTEAVKDRSTDE